MNAAPMVVQRDEKSDPAAWVRAFAGTVTVRGVEVCPARALLSTWRKRATKRGDMASVYFAQLGEAGPIKIGASGDVRARLVQLQTGAPFELRLLGVFPGGEESEGMFHRWFAYLRLRGEWFSPAPELLAVIAAFAEGQP